MRAGQPLQQFADVVLLVGQRATNAMVKLAESLQSLVQHMRNEQQMLRDWVEAQADQQNDIRELLKRLARTHTGA